MSVIFCECSDNVCIGSMIVPRAYSFCDRCERYLLKVGDTRNQPPYVTILYKHQEVQNDGFREKKKKKKSARIESKQLEIIVH